TGDFDRSSESYRLAADSTNAMLFAVGDAWRAAWRRDASIPLYATDGLHPSAAGSYLAALVITARVLGRSPVGLAMSFATPSTGTFTVPPALATLLQAAAAEV